MDIQIKTSAGWQAPNGALGVLSSAPITPVANTTGAFASGVQIGQEQMAPLTGYTDKIADALNPLAQQKTQLATAETQEQLAAIRRRQSVRNYIDQKVGGLAGSPPAASAAAADAAATLPTGGASPGATFTAPKAGALANASATVPGILAPAVAATNGGTQPDGSGTAAPSPDATRPGPTVAKAVPYRGGNVYYEDQNGRQHYDLASGTIVDDKLTRGTETAADNSKRSVFYNELGHPVEGAGTDIKPPTGGGMNKATSAYNQKSAEKFAETASTSNAAAAQLLPLIQEYREVRTNGLKSPDGTVVMPSTGVGAGALGYANAANQYLESRKQKIAMLQNMMKGSQSNIEGERLLKSGPQQSNQDASDLAILDSIERDVSNITNQNKFIGSRISKGSTFDDASSEWAAQNGSSHAPSGAKISAEDTQAIQWLQSNPNDPRAGKVAAALNAKGIGGK